MGQHKQICHTLPSSPTHHHPSDFQFIISLSPPNSSAAVLRPADELFYNGHLLPLHLSPRNSIVNHLLRHSDYHPSFSSRPSSATEYDKQSCHTQNQTLIISNQENKVLACKQFVLDRFSSVSRKPTAAAAAKTDQDTITGSSLKKKIRKYLKKLSKFHSQKTTAPTVKRVDDDVNSYSFSENMKFLTKTSCVSSCPSTMPSSPTPSGRKTTGGCYSNSWSSTEELQSAIQGAIAHCKNSMITG